MKLRAPAQCMQGLRYLLQDALALEGAQVIHHVGQRHCRQVWQLLHCLHRSVACARACCEWDTGTCLS